MAVLERVTSSLGGALARCRTTLAPVRNLNLLAMTKLKVRAKRRRVVIVAFCALGRTGLVQRVRLARGQRPLGSAARNLENLANLTPGVLLAPKITHLVRVDVNSWAAQPRALLSGTTNTCRWR